MSFLGMVFANIIGLIANIGAGSASIWNTYQPKEPNGISYHK